MFTKYLITTLFIVLTVQSALVSVGDNQEAKKPAFFSIFKVPGVAKDETITVSLQWGNQTPAKSLRVFLYKVGDDKPANELAATCSRFINTCTVSFDKTTTTAAGDYWLSIEYSSTFFLWNSHVIVASLTVSGNSSSRINSRILKQTIAIGQYRHHRIFFSNPTNLSVVLPYTKNGQGSFYNAASFVRLYPELEDDKLYKLGISEKPAPTLNSTTQTVTFTFEQVPAGFYWVVVDLGKFNPGAFSTGLATLEDLNVQYRLIYATEPYNCPFSPDYPDYSGIFRGCVVQSDNSKLPCIKYNSVTSICQACLSGYVIVNGRCVQDTCPAGYYKRYGECLQNPTGCAIYSDFAQCTQCVAGYTLATGVCNRTPLTCTGRTYFNTNTWTCDAVSEKCKQWSSTDGKCTSCLDAADKPVNGVCVPIVSTCTERQYVDVQGNCVESDILSTHFEKFGGKCIKCVWGYECSAIQKKCVKIVCPTRYVPNDLGKCIRVSDLCENFDAYGNCLNCIPTHVLSAQGVCLQTERPNPCPDRQYLGEDNFCHEVNEFCEIFNKDNGKCTKCIGGYYLMYTGECVQQTQCKSRQILVNNDCQDVSPTCGNYDRATGKCLNCVSEEYELYYGLCIPVKTCGVRQWSDDNGVCHDVSNRCNTFNPSTGDCTSCVQGYTYLNGICCTNGQFNVNGACVDAADASETKNDNGCRTWVNGIGCVRCDSGFQRTQDQLGFYYCQPL